MLTVVSDKGKSYEMFQKSIKFAEKAPPWNYICIPIAMGDMDEPLCQIQQEEKELQGTSHSILPPC